MSGPLFDPNLRALRRDRAVRKGPALFIAEHLADDLAERVALHHRNFDRALLIGCPAPDIASRLSPLLGTLFVADPGPLAAEVCGGMAINEEIWTAPPGSYDLVLALGTLDSVSDLPRALRAIHDSLTPGGLLLAAMAGGDTLPRLRSAMRAADRVSGSAAPHVHPRIEASALSPLLANVGFTQPVVDIERVEVRYTNFCALVSDLRAMAATNVLRARPRRPLGRRALAAAIADFSAFSVNGKTAEHFHILHASAWKADEPNPQ